MKTMVKLSYGFYIFQSQLIQKAGFHVETHIVQTEDGYLLTLYRIPSNASSVLLQHGLLTSSADWIIPGKDKGLGMVFIGSYLIVVIKNISLLKRLLERKTSRKIIKFQNIYIYIYYMYM